ncbi:Phage FAD/FMN-containing dehydrogenase [plant metagenome]|uniref:Phage FAD/FMN-containing dehydrogenase n=1 Tax=plant metagenome TaxID=1297885 RepID=A0A484T6E8_9ZZZZ
MSFDALETSLDAGRPLSLYHFYRGGLGWSYTTADREITYQGGAFTPVAISDDGRRLTGQTTADALSITAPADLPIAQLYRGAAPAGRVSLTIHDLHLAEDGQLFGMVAWVGSITDVRWPANDRCRITCQAIDSVLDRPGLRLTWQRECPHNLYDRNCRVNPAWHRVGGTIAALDGARVRVGPASGLPDGRYKGGFLEWDVGGGVLEQRGIQGHQGEWLTLFGGTFGLTAGLGVSIYPGCDNVIQTCSDVYGNSPNYGGVPRLPGESPFSGQPIF